MKHSTKTPPVTFYGGSRLKGSGNFHSYPRNLTKSCDRAISIADLRPLFLRAVSLFEKTDKRTLGVPADEGIDPGDGGPGGKGERVAVAAKDARSGHPLSIESFLICLSTEE